MAFIKRLKAKRTNEWSYPPPSFNEEPELTSRTSRPENVRDVMSFLNAREMHSYSQNEIPRSMYKHEDNCTNRQDFHINESQIISSSSTLNAATQMDGQTKKPNSSNPCSVVQWITSSKLSVIYPRILKKKHVRTVSDMSTTSSYSALSDSDEELDFETHHSQLDSSCTDCLTKSRINTHLDTCSAPSENTLSHYTARKLPSIIKEREFSLPETDKIFASEWLSDTEIVLGTKCNKIQILDTITGKMVNIPSVIDQIQENTSTTPTTTNLDSPFDTSIAAAPLNSSFPTTSNSASHETRQIMINSPNCAGIHSISMNPSKTLLAVGGGKQSESIQVYRLPTFEPHSLLNGHKDVIFSVAWLNDDTLISGSRDTSLMCWSLSSDYCVKTSNLEHLTHPISTYTFASSKAEHRGKVRDLKYDLHTKKAFTLSSDGFVKVWDANSRACEVVSAVPLYHTNETVCLGLDSTHHILGVGSQSHISLIDPRSNSIVHIFESCDDGWGVRSMNINHGIVTVGGGLGRISFYDLRARNYLDWHKSQEPSASQHTSQSDFEPSFTSRRAANINRFHVSGGAQSHRQNGFPTHSISTQSFRPVTSPIELTTPTATRFGHLLYTSSFSCEPDLNPTNRLNYLRTGKGWLYRDMIYLNHFQGIDILNAVYTLNYSSNGLNLFAAGGPLQLNLRGSYAAIWK